MINYDQKLWELEGSFRHGPKGREYLSILFKSIFDRPSRIEQQIAELRALTATAYMPVRCSDISQYQGAMNFQKYVEHPETDAVIIRASSVDGYDNLYRDLQWLNNIAGFTALDYPIFAYHYCTAGSRHSPEAQADFFYSITKDQGVLNLVADIEATGGLSATALADWLYRFVKRLELLTGKKPIIYSRATFINSYLGAYPGTGSWSDYEFWCARYTTLLLAGPWADNYFVPKYWTIWWGWQYTSTLSAPVFGAPNATYIDGNYLNFVSLDEFNKRYYGEDVGDEEPEDEIIYLSKGSYKADSGFEFILPNDEILRRLV